MTSQARVQPFPFGALPALARGDLVARQAVRSRLVGANAARLADAWSALTGSPLALAPRGARLRPNHIGTPGDVGILLASGDDLNEAVLLELEGALATLAVAAALRGRAPAVYDTTQLPSARVVGATAAVAVALTRRLCDQPVRVLAAGPAHALAADLRRRSPELATWQGSVELDGARYDVRLTTLPHELNAPRRDTWATLRTPLAVPVVLSRFVLPRSALAELTLGDALMLPDREPRDEQPAWLAPAHGEHAACVTVRGEHVIFGGEPASLPWSEEDMSDSFRESLGDVPVVVRVEVGSVQLPARSWAEISAGDTLVLGQRVGAPVTLRVSGVEVAHGELVQVEGELGVRIVKRLDLPAESA